jgi:fatty-acid desaturase
VSAAAPDMVPIAHEASERIVRTVVFAVPPAALVAGGYLGFHRLFTHRSFKTTFSINSLCHFFGRRPFTTDDQSHNLAWLATLAFGEAWHNNHHAFPTSARHGLRRNEIDPGAWLITGLERCHLAWDVVRISPGRQQAKRGSAES